MLFELMETGMNTLQKSPQNLQHRPNCVSTLPNVKTMHFETALGVHSIELVVCNFHRKPSNLHLFNFFVQNFLSVF